MMIYVANPLYDAVFKYMMEDERIAKTLLSALLQKTVYDYEGNEVHQEMPDPFVESLQHDSIIVQIPLLKGRVNNRLEKILSVFDQSQIYPDDQRMLELDENKYADDAEMAHILHRLQSAAANPDIRNRMNAEDEFFQALEDRDTTIMTQKKELEKQKAAIEEQKAAIEEQKAAIEEKDAALEEQKASLEEKDASLRAAVLALSKSGMNAEMIAKTLNIGEEKIQEILSN